MLDSFRIHALQRICKAYKPSVSADFVLDELNFEDNKEEGYEFLQKAACILIDANLVEEGGQPPDIDKRSEKGHKKRARKPPVWEINTKDSVIDVSGVFTQDKLLA
jgi:hypothetical protein